MRKTLFFILLFFAVFGYAQKPSTDTLKKDSILITKKLVIVNLSPANLNKTEVENYLNQVYSQAVVGWEVKRVENITLDKAIFGEDEQLDAGDSDLMSAYSQEQKDLVKAYQKDHELDQETYYIFVVPSLTGNIQGYMVRGGQVGFVSSQAQNLNRTLAHELGHGAFSLEHTFVEPKLSQGSTQNLMDYGQGTELWVSQWNYLRNPDIIFRPFEKDAEGMSVGDGMAQYNSIIDEIATYEQIEPQYEELTEENYFQEGKLDILGGGDRIVEKDQNGKVIKLYTSPNFTPTNWQNTKKRFWDAYNKKISFPHYKWISGYEAYTSNNLGNKNPFFYGNVGTLIVTKYDKYITLEFDSFKLNYLGGI